jgi:hypothetical protein
VGQLDSGQGQDVPAGGCKLTVLGYDLHQPFQFSFAYVIGEADDLVPKHVGSAYQFDGREDAVAVEGVGVKIENRVALHSAGRVS